MKYRELNPFLCADIENDVETDLYRRLSLPLHAINVNPEAVSWEGEKVIIRINFLWGRPGPLCSKINYRPTSADIMYLHSQVYIVYIIMRYR